MADEATPQPASGADTGTATPTLAPGTGTATPQSAASFPLSAEQRSLSLKVSLADMAARAGALYTHRKYDEAAEVYAQAAEMQAEMNGEMSPENAEILFLYGRSLFKVGQGKSDVLGGKAPAEGKKAAGNKNNNKKKGGKKTAANGAVKTEEAKAGDTPEADRVAQEAVKIIADETSGGKAEKEEVEAKKPLFQFTGDENWDDSDDEEEEEVSWLCHTDDLFLGFALLRARANTRLLADRRGSRRRRGRGGRRRSRHSVRDPRPGARVAEEAARRETRHGHDRGQGQREGRERRRRWR